MAGVLGRRRRRLLWTGGSLTFVVLAAAAVLVWRARADDTQAYRPGERQAEITRRLERQIPDAAPELRFTDVTAAAGLEHATFSGPRSSQLPEDMGPGAAWGDFDADGDDDLLVTAAGARLDAPPEQRSAVRLYENLGDGSFRPVAGFPDIRILGTGVAWGDFDADGRLDLALSGNDTLRLYRNRPHGFVLHEEVAVPRAIWAGLAWGDFDGDRDLDLYVCGYVRYQAEQQAGPAGAAQYGQQVPFTLNPSSHAPSPNLLLRNDGGGRFTEVAAEVGVDNPEGRSLGAVWHDFDADGHLDLYVANDVSDNMLYLNRGGRFADVSHAAWVADYRGAMGLAVGDWNADGDDDLFITHWVAQENALYDAFAATSARGAADTAIAAAAGTGAGAGKDADSAAAIPALRFVDVADQAGLGQVALPFIGWGAEFADLDADGWLDLIVANGSTFETDDEPPRLRPQPPFVFWNEQGRAYHDLAATIDDLAVPRIGRGLAVSDYDRDGDLDFVLMDHDAGARLFRNDTSDKGNWLQVRLRSRLAPDGPALGHGDGAVLIANVGERRLRRSVTLASYLSQSSRTVHFGLGNADRIDAIEILWPEGASQRHGPLAAGQTWEIIEGEAEARAIESPGSADLEARGTERERVMAFWKHQRAGMRAMKTDGDIPAAIAHLRRALALDPEHEDSLYALGHCLARQGDIAGALQQFTRLVKVDPMSQRGHRQLGLLLAAAARSRAALGSAEESLQRALEINPEESGVRLDLAGIRLLRGESAGARQHLEWVIRSNPRSTGGFFLLGYLEWQAGAAEAARARLGQARRTRGPEWKPEGTTAEGDTGNRQIVETAVLSRFWTGWDGDATHPGSAYAPLHRHLAAMRATPGGAGGRP